MTTLFAAAVAVDAFFAALQSRDLAAVEKMLAAEPSLASAKDAKGVSAVARALHASTGEGFLPRRENRVLDAVLARKPQLSGWDVFSVGTAEQVRAALAADASVLRARAGNGWTALHYAAFADNAAAAAALLGAGAEVDARAKNKFDNTPLQVGMLSQAREAARVLLALGANPNLKMSEGFTALHEAAANGDVPSIEILLAAGADQKLLSPDGKSPLDLARERKQEAAIKALQR